jgi:hypothetical protein
MGPVANELFTCCAVCGERIGYACLHCRGYEGCTTGLALGKDEGMAERRLIFILRGEVMKRVQLRLGRRLVDLLAGLRWISSRGQMMLGGMWRLRELHSR